jgi:hypothetical protein
MVYGKTQKRKPRVTYIYGSIVKPTIIKTTIKKPPKVSKTAHVAPKVHHRQDKEFFKRQAAGKLTGYKRGGKAMGTKAVKPSYGRGQTAQQAMMQSSGFGGTKKGAGFIGGAKHGRMSMKQRATMQAKQQGQKMERRKPREGMEMKRRVKLKQQKKQMGKGYSTTGM